MLNFWDGGNIYVRYPVSVRDSYWKPGGHDNARSPDS